VLHISKNAQRKQQKAHQLNCQWVCPFRRPNFWRIWGAELPISEIAGGLSFQTGSHSLQTGFESARLLQLVIQLPRPYGVRIFQADSIRSFGCSDWMHATESNIWRSGEPLHSYAAALFMTRLRVRSEG
jgi:hypothetical protein